MKSNWTGNHALQGLVKSGGAVLRPEVVQIVDSHVKVLKSQWDTGTVTGGSIETLPGGGARLLSTATSSIPLTANNGTDNTALGLAPFDAVLVTWLDAGAEAREIHNLVARLDPRDDGGAAKTVAYFVAELFSVDEIDEEGVRYLVPISIPAEVAATGEVAADFTFNFQGTGGGYPIVGGPPIGASDSKPQTLIRITALRDTGLVADNVTWLGDSVTGATKTDSSTYSATHYTVAQPLGYSREYSGGSAYIINTTVANYPEFTLNRAEYDSAVITFDGANEVPDLTGTGDFVIVARGETPSDSALTYEISDDGGANWYDCFDGDLLATDNTADGGGDLTAVSTTGPWDIRVTLTPSTAADLNTPTVRELGVESIVSTFLTGAAELVGGLRQVDPFTLKGNIAAADLVIYKFGENDYRDYGSDVLARNNIGDVHVRIWVADADGSQLTRRQWMLHSVWDVDDYVSTDTAHRIMLISPLRRLKNVIIPPFVVTSGSDGTRTAQYIPSAAGTVKDAYDEIVDSLVALSGRLRGQSPDEDTETVQKWIARSDAKDEVDRLAYLSGGAVVESQGRIGFVKIVRDGAGADTPVTRFPVGSYIADDIGPGYSTRTDEFFVRSEWDDGTQSFVAERRYLNAAALDKLGGVGINTTQELDEETCKWITTSALSDLVGKRVTNHFATGMIVWSIRSIEAHPELEVGDAVSIEATRFVGRSPLNEQEIRGRVSALGVVIEVGDPWGRELAVWIPSFEHIVVATGTVTRRKFDNPGLLHIDTSTRSHTGNLTLTTKQAFEVPALYQGGVLYGVRARGVFESTGAGGTKTVTVSHASGLGWSLTLAVGNQVATIDVLIEATGATAGRATDLLATGWPSQIISSPVTVNVAADIDFDVQLANAGDTVTLTLSEVSLVRVL